MEIEQVKQSLQAMAKQAEANEKPLDHILLYGDYDLSQDIGKYISTMLPYLPRRMYAKNFERVGDLAAVLTHLKRNDILLVDEVQYFTPAVLEVLYEAMSENKLDIVIGKGTAAKNVRLNLPAFTLIASTTQITQVPQELLWHFSVQFRLDH